MVKRFLVTTADERSRPTDQPILFLGNWCRLYGRRHVWEKLDAEVVPYHWDDREKYFRDFSRLQASYEKLLAATVEALNRFHGGSHSVHYWRILIGPWLYTFMHVLFDRWSMVKLAASSYDISGTSILDFDPAGLIPLDFKHVNPDSVEWNHYLFGKALKQQQAIPWQSVTPESTQNALSMKPATSAPVRRRGTALKALFDSAIAKLTRCDEAMIITSYLPRFEEMKLQLALGQIPKVWRAQEPAPCRPDFSSRQNLKIESAGIDEFEDFVCAMIPEQIPVVYLEGYAQLGRQADALPWPARPKVIFTSNLYQFNEVFQIWAAKKIEAGAPLVIGQHGGIMGVGKWVPGEDHQVDIADRYLTWGWRDGRPQTLPALAFTIVNRATGKWNPQGKILLVSSPMRVYSYRSSSWPVGPNQSAQFIAEQLGFARALDAAVRARLLLRINTRQDRKTSCFYTEQWRDEFPGVEIDDSTQPIEKCLSQCRLFVYSFNSTGFLETLGRNIPTVIFWNPRYFELRSDAQPFFDRLKAVGIFHDNPESAARHISGIWADVAGWWNQAVVQEARRHFCARFAHTSKKPVRELSKSLAAICRS